MPRPDPTTLLCESCGYPIGELPREGNCPECGRAIAESLPERRVGTPWQQKRGVRSWARTVWMVTRRPRMIWRVVRVESPRSALLAIWNCGLTMVGLAAWWIVPRFVYEWRDPQMTVSDVIEASGVLMALVLGGWCALLTLTAVEFAGVRFYARRRRWRVSRPVALSVVGHASVGWLLLALTLPPCWGFVTDDFMDAFADSANVGSLRAAAWTLAIVAGPGIPLLAFELLVYMGVRRMRFANSETPASSRRA